MEMNELLQAVRELDEKLGNLRVLLHLDEKEKRVQVLSKEAAKPDFWNKQEHARAISKQLGDVQSEVGEWQALRKDLTAVLEIAELDEKDQGVNLREELETQYKSYVEDVANNQIDAVGKLEKALQEAREQLKRLEGVESVSE